MPVTNLEDRRKLIEAGADPDTLGDLPPLPTTSNPPARTSSAAGAFTRQFVSGIPSSVAALTAGAVSSPFVTPLGGMAVGAATGVGTEKLQHKLIEQLPEGISKPILEQEQADITQHPYWSAGGRLLSGGILARPDFKGLLAAGRMALGGETTALGEQALKLAGINALSQAGISYGIKSAQERTLTPHVGGEDLLGLVGGALSTKPTALGMKLPGMKGMVPPKEEILLTNKPKPLEEVLPTPEEEALANAEANRVTKVEEVPTTVDEEVIPEKGDSSIDEVVPSEEDLKFLRNERAKHDPDSEEFKALHDYITKVQEAKETSTKANDEFSIDEPPLSETEMADLQKKISTAKDNGFDVEHPETLEGISKSPVPPHTIPEEHSDTTNPVKNRFIFSAIDAIRKKGPLGLKAGDTMAKFYDTATFYRGKLVNSFANNIRNLADLGGIANKVKSPLQYLRQNTPDLENVRDWFWAHADGTPIPTLTPKQETIRDEFIRSNQQVRAEHIASGIPSSGTFDPTYLAQMIDGHVLKTLTDPNSPESIRLKNEYLKYATDKAIAKGVLPAKAAAQAAEKLKAIVDANPRLSNNTSAQFGPIDKAAGEGIPISWRNHNIIDTQNRYLSRVARRFAYEKTIKPDEELVNSYYKDKNGKFVIDDISGTRENADDPITTQLRGIARSAVTGTYSGVRDLVSNFTLGLQHLEGVGQLAKNTAKSWMNIKEGLADGFETGRIRRHMNSLEFGNGYDDVIGLLRRSRDVMTDVTGRNYADQMARASGMGIAKYTTLDFLNQVGKGNLSKQGKAWFENFGKGTNWKSGTLTPEEVKTISAHYVDSTQGTYDPRMLPRQAFEGSFSPFLDLARFPIEKANNFVKYNIHPAMDGNFKPLLNSTLGIVLGGSMVKAVSSLMSGRKDRDPSTGELIASAKAGNNIAMPTIYKLMGLASAAGNIGAIGDATKYILDRTYGKNRPQVYNNILLSSADNAASIITSYIEKVGKDGFNGEDMATMIGAVLENTTQNYRLMNAYLSSNTQEDIDKANKLRDLRVYNTMAGNKIQDLSSPFKVSMQDLKLKQFKNEQDPTKVAGELIPLLDRANKRSGGDDTKLQQEFDSLKSNSYQTFPEPKKNPKEFDEYYEFLKTTQGEAEANKRVEDYFMRNTMNKAKASAVP